ncbi:SCO6745 family protein [Cryptosporangium japonicum]|uniref:SalK n=1 Tax=Cryptosporangium japonicum TaxID=80872 RepID=A0ABN0VA40_9ACTN
MPELRDPYPALARRAWQVLEVVHVLSYFAPETRQATDALGLKGYWMGYFGCRAAPLGAVSAATVTATFHNFHPGMVQRAVPDVWGYASPEQLIEARLAGVDASLRRLFGDQVAADPNVGRATELAVEAASAVRGAEVSGRPLAAANAALTVPDEPHLALWHALTVLREHRGDGHVSLLVTGEIGPVEAHILAIASGRSSAELLRTARKWSDEDWDAGVENLVGRGWLREDWTLTPQGVAARETLEDDTDQLASGPYRVLGTEATAELTELLTPLATTIVAAGVLPFPNPVGVPAPGTD